MKNHSMTLMKPSVFVFVFALGTILLASTALAQNPSATPPTKRPLGQSTPTTSKQLMVKIYLQEEFKGKVIQVSVPKEARDQDELEKLGIANDGIQSMIIPPGVKVTLYDENGYKGKSHTYKGPVGRLGEMRNVTSALKITLEPKPNVSKPS